ncbi:MAG: AI-2E family transporter [Clostridia bacterium]|nr:AI-2E family transporter [Clostridia bacterium]
MKFKWDRKYLYAGVTAFCVVAASGLLVWLLFNWPTVGGFVRGFFSAIAPIVYGFVIAYLLTPVCNFAERRIFRPLCIRNSVKHPKKAIRRARYWSVTFSVVFLLLFIAGLLWLVLPQVIDSLKQLVQNVPVYFNGLIAWAEKMLADYPDLQASVLDLFSDFSANIVNIISGYLVPELSALVTNLTSGVIAVLGTVFNIIVGIVVAVYFLSRKEMFIAQVKKLVYAVMPLAGANSLVHNAQLTHKKFGGFFTAKIINSLLIGIVAYPCLLVLGMPYPELMAVIMCVTDIIPIFGPFIGAVPCALLALMDGPIDFIIVIVFIIVLQQIDGNIIGPRLLGENTGLNSVWVIAALALGKWLFGFVGMIIGVPLLAVLYTIIATFCDRRLREKELPNETMAFHNLTDIDPITNEAHYQKESEKESAFSGGIIKRWLAKLKKK